MEQSEVRALLEEARNKRPLMQQKDAVKLLYQRSFGPGHLVRDKEKALAFLKSEWEQTESGETCLYEPIGNDLCRLNLAPAKALGAKADSVCGLFLRCAGHVFSPPEDWPECLSAVEALDFPNDDKDFSLAKYRAGGCPPLHHSETYRKTYRPAYRVVWEREAQYLPLFAALDKALSKPRSKPFFLAIDGMASSGKTTLGALIHDLYGGVLLHMDDFFLPPERKTPERLAQPGGNVDRERFGQELLFPLLRGETGTLRRYNCQKGECAPPVEIVPAPLIVVEGAYCLHPKLRDAFELRVFCSVTPEEQRVRILKRNGAVMWKKFETQWIPMENAYFKAFEIPKLCQLHF